MSYLKLSLDRTQEIIKKYPYLKLDSFLKLDVEDYSNRKKIKQDENIEWKRILKKMKKDFRFNKTFGAKWIKLTDERKNEIKNKMMNKM